MLSQVPKAQCRHQLNRYSPGDRPPPLVAQRSRSLFLPAACPRAVSVRHAAAQADVNPVYFPETGLPLANEVALEIRRPHSAFLFGLTGIVVIEPN
jgi:hypothetical protein